MERLLQRLRRCSSSSSVVILPLFLVFFLPIFLEKAVGVVSALEYSKDKQASSSTLESIQKYLAKINKPAVLTIESPDGEIVDCVDKWKQPAFDHPLLKDHKFQLDPPKMRRGMMRIKEEEMMKGENNNIPSEAGQAWHKNGTRCPKGTVPILRITVEDVLRAGSLQDFVRKPRKTALAAFNANVSVSPNNDDGPVDLPHEYAVINSNPGSVLYGASAGINVWNPHIENVGEMSISQIWLAAGEYHLPNLNTIEAGWLVYPNSYGDFATHLFVYWTADGYRTTGCYNLRCPGFVQVDEHIIVGSILNPPSTISGKQYEAVLNIYKDRATGDWVLGYGENNIKVGFWPASLFTTLRDSAREAQWGGEVTNRRLNHAHTATQMGSSRFAQEGFNKASYFRQVKVLDSNYEATLPVNPITRVDNVNCYNILLGYSNDFMGSYFYYGGPGYSPICP